MDDFMYRRDDPRDPEIERLLDAFAELRLSPSLAATTRMRPGVMAAAHRRAALLAGRRDGRMPLACDLACDADRAVGSRARRFAGAGRRPRSGRHPDPRRARGHGRRRGAGGPLYATRIWIETVNLPRDVLARAQAEVIRLDRRVQEARDASAAGDTAATEAALDAYSTIVDEATSETRRRSDRDRGPRCQRHAACHGPDRARRHGAGCGAAGHRARPGVEHQGPPRPRAAGSAAGLEQRPGRAARRTPGGAGHPAARDTRRRRDTRRSRDPGWAGRSRRRARTRRPSRRRTSTSRRARTGRRNPISTTPRQAPHTLLPSHRQ